MLVLAGTSFRRQLSLMQSGVKWGLKWHDSDTTDMATQHYNSVHYTVHWLAVQQFAVMMTLGHTGYKVNFITAFPFVNTVSLGKLNRRSSNSRLSRFENE